MSQHSLALRFSWYALLTPLQLAQTKISSSSGIRRQKRRKKKQTTDVGLEPTASAWSLIGWNPPSLGGLRATIAPTGLLIDDGD